MSQRPNCGRPATVFVTVAAFIITSACSDAHVGVAPTVRDSAGVEIVEYAAIPPLTPTLVTDSVPLLDLGGLMDNPDEEFNATQPFLRPVFLSDGRIAVNDWSSIKFFDSEGKFLKSVGSSGRGPGQFHQITDLCRLSGDTLLALDAFVRRMSIWDGQGNFVREMSQAKSPTPEPCFPDGTLIVRQPRTTMGGGSAESRMTYRYAIVDVDGATVTDIGQFTRGGIGPLAPRLSLVAAGDRYYVGEARTFEVRAYSKGGDLIRIIRAAADPVSITDADRRAELDRSVPRNVRGAEREARIDQDLARVMAMPHPETYPAYRMVHVGSDGRIWIQRYENTRAWTVFDSTGMLVGTLVLDSSPNGPVQLKGSDEKSVTLETYDSDRALHVVVLGLSPAR